MKKFTKKAMMLLLFTTFASLLAIQAQTVKRYVFELAGYPIDDPNWKQEWIDLRPDNYERSLLLWSATLVNATPLGTGSLGQNAPYKAFTVNKNWWGAGYYIAGPKAGNNDAKIDLTDVDGSWYFHFAIRTDCATDINVILYGSTSNPSDTTITEKTKATYKLTTATLPLSKRDKMQWVEYNIPMADLMTSGLVYLGILQDQNYLTFGGGNDKGKFVAWDNAYIEKVSTGLNPLKIELLNYSITGNLLNVFNNNSNERIDIFNSAGIKILTSEVNCIDISNLSPGIYIVKSANKANKFSKRN